jgi:hypothetical protein
MLGRWLLGALILLFSPSAEAQDAAVDLELVLAVDASSSVDEAEWSLQMGGIAAGFRHPRVQEAIRSGATGRIAVAVVMWADATLPTAETDWFVLASPDDANRFADMAESLPRGVIGGTGIGAGIAAAIRKLDRNGIASLRQVVDVCGDGRETPAREIVVTMPVARGMALARGVTINGLAIQNEEPDLAEWYRDHVIAGPESFVVPAAGFDDFAQAMVRKLIREIEHAPKVGVLGRE